VKTSPAYQAIAELERRAAARLACADATLAHLIRDKQNLLAHHVRARQSMLGSSHWRGLECQALAAHMTWVAAGAARISAVQRQEMNARAGLARERMHWARCRIGLERRLRRDVPRTWPD
jgi:hypothetical protein